MIFRSRRERRFLIDFFFGSGFPSPRVVWKATTIEIMIVVDEGFKKNWLTKNRFDSFKKFGFFELKKTFEGASCFIDEKKISIFFSIIFDISCFFFSWFTVSSEWRRLCSDLIRWFFFFFELVSRWWFSMNRILPEQKNFLSEWKVERVWINLKKRKLDEFRWKYWLIRNE